jgi:hypothetical protein
MITAGNVEFEPEYPKIYSITNSVALMVAGDSALQIEIFYKLYAWVSEQIAANPTRWLPVEDVAKKYYLIYQEIKSSRAEARVLIPLGMNLNTLRVEQRSMLDSVAGDITRAILNFENACYRSHSGRIGLLRCTHFRH